MNAAMGAFGGVAGGEVAKGAVNLASRVGGVAADSMGRAMDHACGRRSSKFQRTRLTEYRRLFSSCCTPSTTTLFDFDEDKYCPITTKDDVKLYPAKLVNADSPFNVCQERRALVRGFQRSLEKLRTEEHSHLICSPEILVLYEMRQWAESIGDHPSQDLVTQVQGRNEFLNELNIYWRQQNLKPMPDILDPLGILEEFVLTCQRKASYYDLQQSLPRIHGGANVICENMDVILPRVLSCTHFKRPCRASTSEDQISLHPMFEKLERTTSRQLGRLSRPAYPSVSVDVHGKDEILQPEEVLQRLRGTTKEIVQCNWTLRQFMEFSDGLPITSVPRVDVNVVDTLEDCLYSLNGKLAFLGQLLHVLCSRCNAWQAVEHKSSDFTRWLSNYDSVRAELVETRAAVLEASEQIAVALRVLGDGMSLAGTSRKRHACACECPAQKLQKIKQE